MKLSAVIHTKCILIAVTVICNWGSPSCSGRARVKTCSSFLCAVRGEVQISWESVGFTCVLCVHIVLACVRFLVAGVVSRKVGGSSGQWFSGSQVGCSLLDGMVYMELESL